MHESEFLKSAQKSRLTTDDPRQSVDHQGSSETILSDDEARVIGTIVGGKFRIVAAVGRGGMGVVYRAEHITLNKPVAVKILSRIKSADKEKDVRRFDQEAKAASKLNNPHVAAVSDYGLTEDGSPYLVMDYADGNSLSSLIENHGPFDSARAIGIFQQVCEGIQEAHSKGIVHRDLKPSNVMVETAFGTDVVIVVDFGIAKVIDPDEEMAKLTQTGDVFGSPLYMSPEQCMGKLLDERSDIYSMGCLMYETLKGKPPHVGANVLDTLSKQITDDPETIAGNDHSDVLLRRLNAIVFKCLKKDPSQRYRSMIELHRDLDLAKQKSEAEWKQAFAARLNTKLSSKQKVINIGVAALVVMLITSVWSFSKPFQSSTKSAPPIVSEPARLKAAEICDEGMALLKQKHYEDAMEKFEESIQNNPQDSQAYFGKAMVYKSRDSFDHEIEALKKAIQYPHDDQARPLLEMENAYRQIEDYQTALVWCNELIAIAPAHKWAYHDRGICYENLNEYDKAMQDYKKQLELAPRSAWTLWHIAELLKKEHKEKEALFYYEKGFALWPYDHDKHLRLTDLGDAYLSAKQPQKAVDLYSKWIDSSPKDSEAFRRRAHAYSMLGKSELANKDLKTASQLEPNIQGGLMDNAELLRLKYESHRMQGK